MLPAVPRVRVCARSSNQCLPSLDRFTGSQDPARADRGGISQAPAFTYPVPAFTPGAKVIVGSRQSVRVPDRDAVVESFLHTLKVELVHHRRYLTRDEARQDIFEWVEVFYNRQRRHSTLGYRSPAEFEAMSKVA